MNKDKLVPLQKKNKKCPIIKGVKYKIKISPYLVSSKILNKDLIQEFTTILINRETE